EQLEAALKVYEDIVAESHGVAGWHLNGDLAEWGEFDLPQIAGDRPPEDDWLVYECSLCHWKIQALATNKPQQCKMCTNFSMREQTVGESGK
ncbi:hypothetical protein LCGC14_3002760, partial [marine sediment metagenome]